MKAFYDRHAPEYDDWWPAVRALPPVRTLDVACGTRIHQTEYFLIVRA